MKIKFIYEVEIPDDNMPSLESVYHRYLWAMRDERIMGKCGHADIRIERPDEGHIESALHLTTEQAHWNPNTGAGIDRFGKGR